MLKKVLFFLAIVSFITSLAMPLQAMAKEPVELDKDSYHDHVYHEYYLRHDAMRPHFNFYYDLLIDRYQPELQEEWRLIVNERETLIKKYKELKKEGKLKDPVEKDESWKTEHQNIHERFLNAVKERNDEAIEEVLPDLLALQKEMNEFLKSQIKPE